MQSIVDRFLRYVRVNTCSDPANETVPSTACQLDLARLLVQELKELGLQDVNLNEKGFVTATLPANVPYKTPVVGWIAHMDTSPDFSGEHVKPQMIFNYDGRDIALKGKPGMLLSPGQFPELKKYVGKTLITTDGSTLLGADDKAGVAEIMSALETLAEHPEIQHGVVKVAFTPDEETGQGAGQFDVAAFGADLAYTMDGGEVGELNYENFNAAGARITLNGLSVHPGSAKNKMVNALQLAHRVQAALPTQEVPELTEGYEGFFHLTSLNGHVAQATMTYIIRDHDRQKFEAKKALLQSVCSSLNQSYGEGTAVLEMRDQYYNMKERLDGSMFIVETALAGMRELGIEPLVLPIRGGTDGAQFSYKGLLTPNLFTGGHACHGPYEFVCVESMNKAVELIVKVTEIYARQKK